MCKLTRETGPADFKSAMKDDAASIKIVTGRNLAVQIEIELVRIGGILDAPGFPREAIILCFHVRLRYEWSCKYLIGTTLELFAKSPSIRQNPS